MKINKDTKIEGEAHINHFDLVGRLIYNKAPRNISFEINTWRRWEQVSLFLGGVFEFGYIIHTGCSTEFVY